MIYGNVIRLCRENGITVRQLEKKVGLGNGTIGCWRKSSPGIKAVVAVADYFAVSLDALVGRGGM